MTWDFPRFVFKCKYFWEQYVLFCSSSVFEIMLRHSVKSAPRQCTVSILSRHKAWWNATYFSFRMLSHLYDTCHVINVAKSYVILKFRAFTFESRVHQLPPMEVPSFAPYFRYLRAVRAVTSARHYRIKAKRNCCQKVFHDSLVCVFFFGFVFALPWQWHDGWCYSCCYYNYYHCHCDFS